MSKYWLISDEDVTRLGALIEGEAQYVLDTGLHLTDSIPLDFMEDVSASETVPLSIEQLQQALIEAPQPNGETWDYWIEDTIQGDYIKFYPEFFGKSFCKVLANIGGILREVIESRQKALSSDDGRSTEDLT